MKSLSDEFAHRVQQHEEWQRSDAQQGHQLVVEDADLREVNLSGRGLADALLPGANLEGAILRGTDLFGANLASARLDRADLTDASLGKAQLDYASLVAATLLRASLRRASLVEADLSGADALEADLRGTYLTRANLSHADLRRTQWHRALLDETLLAGADLGDATGLEEAVVWSIRTREEAGAPLLSATDALQWLVREARRPSGRSPDRAGDDLSK